MPKSCKGNQRLPCPLMWLDMISSMQVIGTYIMVYQVPQTRAGETIAYDKRAHQVALIFTCVRSLQAVMLTITSLHGLAFQDITLRAHTLPDVHQQVGLCSIGRLRVQGGHCWSSGTWGNRGPAWVLCGISLHCFGLFVRGRLPMSHVISNQITPCH
jgi:hypothetical protein